MADVKFSHLLTFIVTVTLSTNEVGGSGRLGVTMVRYDNPTGLADNGNCCDSLFSSGYMCRMNPCDPYFIVCIGNSSSTDSTDEGHCDIVRFETDVVHDEDSTTFDTDIGENPRSAAFEFWPDSFLVKVDVWDHDGGHHNRDDLIEKLSYEFTLKPKTEENSEVISSIHLMDRTSLQMALDIRCDPDYYGPRCDCHPEDDDVKGHYRCDVNGVKICHAGWTGRGCTVNVDECQSNPCLNGGRCLDMVNGFECDCPPQVDGVYCEFPQVEFGGGWFSLTMVNFSNPSGHGDNGNCCDSVTSSESTCRINPCDPYFLMCMGSEESNCDLLEFETDEFNDQDSVVFGTDVGGWTNPGYGYFTSWPETLHLTVGVWDSDTGLFDADDRIEILTSSFDIRPTANYPTSSLRVHHLVIRGRTTMHFSLVAAFEDI